jgi:hypothetical protein
MIPRFLFKLFLKITPTILKTSFHNLDTTKKFEKMISSWAFTMSMCAFALEAMLHFICYYLLMLA